MTGFRVSFTRMDAGTTADYRRLGETARVEHDGLAETVLGALVGLRGFNPGYAIDRYRHSLQTATRALRDGADDELISVALLHDIGDLLAPENHSAYAAAVLRPYVSDENHWLVLHHGVFQGYYYFHHFGRDRDAREAFRGHPAFEKTAAFCENWDQRSFDPDYDTLPLDAFEPRVRRLFATPRESFV